MFSKNTVLASASGASVNKSVVPASVSSICELKNTIPAIDFHRVFEGRANIVSLSSFLLAFFLCVICLFMFLSFRLGVALQRSFYISVFLSFFPLGCNFTAVFRSCCLYLLLSFSSACDHSFTFLSVFRVVWFVIVRT